MTLCPRLSDDLQQIDNARKTAVISRELKRLNIDIAALQETRLPSNGTLKEEDCTFFWQGKAPVEHRVHGVGFVVSNSLLSSVETPSKGIARILSLCLNREITSSPFTKCASTVMTQLCILFAVVEYSEHTHDSPCLPC